MGAYEADIFTLVDFHSLFNLKTQHAAGWCVRQFSPIDFNGQNCNIKTHTLFSIEAVLDISKY